MVLTVVGNRPQFVKAAAVSRHLRALVDEQLVHTGQHYDYELSQVFFEELGIPAPDRNLEVGSGTHAAQTAKTMLRLEPVFDTAPSAVLVYGDTNATLAATLVASKMGIPVAHVEAGMRSFDRSMPEEVNRIAVDRLADLHLCSSQTAVDNLEREGLGERASLTGDVMADLALELGELAESRSEILEHLQLQDAGYLVATLHRVGNVDRPEPLRRAVGLLTAVAAAHGPLVLPLHPRTRSRLEADGLLETLQSAPGVVLLDPLGYLDFACLYRRSRAVLTDSGGLQKEAFLAGVPCLTLRRETEWVETLAGGWNLLVGLDADAALAGLELVDAVREGPQPDRSVFGDGRAGERCARLVAEWVATAG